MILKKIKNKILKFKNKKISPKKIEKESEYTNLKHIEPPLLYNNNEYTLNFLKKENKDPHNDGYDELHTIFHCYWYGLINEKHIFSIKSALYTQKNCEIWLWIDECTWNLNQNNKYLDEIKKLITIKKYSPVNELKNSPFSKMKKNFIVKNDLTLRADAFRVLILYKFPGIYFDLDVFFLKDLRSLYKNKYFIYQWEKESYGNNALIYFQDNKIFNTLADVIIKNKTFRPWIIFYYGTPEIKDLTVLPCAFFDPIWNITDEKAYNYPITKFEDFFKKTDCNIKSISDFFPGCYTYHWHNLWKNEIEEDSLFDIFDKELNEKLGIK